MSAWHFKTALAPVVWLEPHRADIGGKPHRLDGLPGEDRLAPLLAALPQGPTAWIVDDLWAPSLLLREVVALPTGTEARDAFFRWKLAQSLALETPHAVQSLALEDGIWLLTGMREELREGWLQTALRLGRPIHSLLPRWLYLYNRLAPTRERPGMLLSLCPHPEGGYTGTLAAWGRTLALLRQWSEPADATTWQAERVAPTSAYLQRDSRPPQELWVWGADAWPDAGLPLQLIQPGIPAQEAL